MTYVDPSPSILSICSGAFDVLSLAVELVRASAGAVCYVEREAFAAASLAHSMEAEMLASAPIWSDLSTFNGKAWRGCVDLVVASLPCQPYSVAGAQRGHDDERAIWPEFVHRCQFASVRHAACRTQPFPRVMQACWPKQRSPKMKPPPTVRSALSCNPGVLVDSESPANCHSSVHWPTKSATFFPAPMHSFSRRHFRRRRTTSWMSCSSRASTRKPVRRRSLSCTLMHDDNGRRCR